MIPVVLSIGLSMCGKDVPIVKMGTGLDDSGRAVTGETTTFSTSETMAFSLSQDEAFDSSVINVRIYRGNDIFDMVRVFNEEIPVTMEMKSIGKSFLPWDFTAKNGAGNYQLLFVIGEKVIARKNFVVKAPNVQFVPVVNTEMEPETKPETKNVTDGKLNDTGPEKAAE